MPTLAKGIGAGGLVAAVVTGQSPVVAADSDTEFICGQCDPAVATSKSLAVQVQNNNALTTTHSVCRRKSCTLCCHAN